MEKGLNLIPLFKSRNPKPTPSDIVNSINIVETIKETVQEESTESFNENTGLLKKKLVRIIRRMVVLLNIMENFKVIQFNLLPILIETLLY